MVWPLPLRTNSPLSLPRFPDSGAYGAAEMALSGGMVVQPVRRPPPRPRARIDRFVRADPLPPGTAADVILLDGAAGLAMGLVVVVVACAPDRPGAMWSGAGAEPVRTSSPVDTILGVGETDPAFDRPGESRPSARLIPMRRRASDTIDMIFSDGDLAAVG